MEKQSEVELFGLWGSPYCTRVELALKLKGIPYKYIEEDLTDKSELLLHYNPVHKKVPVLVHNGKPISESLVILEYIEEQWNNTPKLLPEDPYERAKVRFWTNFYDQKVGSSSLSMIMCKGKDQEKVIEEYSESLGVFEEGIEKDFPGKRSPFFNGENLGFLDIVESWAICRIFKKNSSNTTQRAISNSWVSPILPETTTSDMPTHSALTSQFSSDHNMFGYYNIDLPQSSSITSFFPLDIPSYKPINQMTIKPSEQIYFPNQDLPTCYDASTFYNAIKHVI